MTTCGVVIVARDLDSLHYRTGIMQHALLLRRL